MTVQEVFSNLGQRMVEGLMTHSQMVDYFNFLGLKGYAKCHKYHYFEENANYKRVGDYFIKHYNKLILDLPVDNPHVIPEPWFQHSRPDVSKETRKTYIKAGWEKWVAWEKESKAFYEKMYQELMNMGEVAAAAYVGTVVDDVSDELAAAEQKWLELSAIDYDIVSIMEEQQSYCNKYNKKLKEIKL